MRVIVAAITPSSTRHVAGPDRSEPTAVVDLLPPEVAYVSDDCDGSLHSADPGPVGSVDLPAGNYWVWRIGELRNRQTETCLITVQVVAAGTDIRNVAAVISHGREGGLHFQNNTDDAVINGRLPTPPVPAAADLSITKSGPPRVDAGARFRWTMTVTNNGPAASSGVTASDQIPASIRRPSTSTPGCDIRRRALTCTIGALGPGESSEIVVTGLAPLRGGRCVTNAALVTGDQVDNTATNNHAMAQVCTRGAPRLRLTKSTRRNVVRPGEVFSYRIVVRNTGAVAARRVRVCDQPSADLEIVRAPGADEVSPRRACWDIRLLRAGRRRAFEVIAQVVAGADPGVKPNTATASAANVRGRLQSIARVRVRPPAGACPAVSATASC